MPELLYLDTARLGQMSLGAQHAQSEFHSLAGDIGCSMYFEEFLREGFPTPRDGFPRLNSWRGIAGLKKRLKRFVGGDAASRVLLANRSSQLMTLAAHLLARRCSHVLITDLCWTAYARILRDVAARHGCRVSCLPLRQAIFNDRLTTDDVVDSIRQAFDSLTCDGLFLPLVDNLGIHVPVRRCIAAIRQSSQLNFVAIDGAQALGHVPVNLADLQCDFFLGGCHKWLQAYQPLGLGFVGRSEDNETTDRLVDELQQTRVIDDPLFDFTEVFNSAGRPTFGETVNLTPLITCHGTLADAETSQPRRGRHHWRNCLLIAEAVGGTDWRLAQTAPGLQTKIVLMEQMGVSTLSADRIRRQFHDAGIALTAYANHTVRLSLPDTPLTNAQVGQLTRALQALRPRTGLPVEARIASA